MTTPIQSPVFSATASTPSFESDENSRPLNELELLRLERFCRPGTPLYYTGLHGSCASLRFPFSFPSLFENIVQNLRREGYHVEYCFLGGGSVATLLNTKAPLNIGDVDCYIRINHPPKNRTAFLKTVLKSVEDLEAFPNPKSTALTEPSKKKKKKGRSTIQPQQFPTFDPTPGYGYTPFYSERPFFTEPSSDRTLRRTFLGFTDKGLAVVEIDGTTHFMDPRTFHLTQETPTSKEEKTSSLDLTDGGLKNKSFREDRLFLTFPCTLEGKLRCIDLTISWSPFLDCTCSYDSLRINLLPLFKEKSFQEITLTTTQDYSLTKTLDCLERKVFFVEPLSAITEIKRGTLRYIYTISKGHLPEEKKIETLFLEKLIEENPEVFERGLRTFYPDRLDRSLSAYLEGEGGLSLEGFIFLWNFEAALTASCLSQEKKEIYLPIVQRVMKEYAQKIKEASLEQIQMVLFWHSFDREHARYIETLPGDRIQMPWNTRFIPFHRRSRTLLVPLPKKTTLTFLSLPHSERKKQVELLQPLLEKLGLPQEEKALFTFLFEKAKTSACFSECLFLLFPFPKPDNQNKQNEKDFLAKFVIRFLEKQDQIEDEFIPCLNELLAIYYPQFPLKVNKNAPTSILLFLKRCSNEMREKIWESLVAQYPDLASLRNQEFLSPPYSREKIESWVALKTETLSDAGKKTLEKALQEVDETSFPLLLPVAFEEGLNLAPLLKRAKTLSNLDLFLSILKIMIRKKQLLSSDALQKLQKGPKSGKNTGQKYAEFLQEQAKVKEFTLSSSLKSAFGLFYIQPGKETDQAFFFALVRELDSPDFPTFLAAWEKIADHFCKIKPPVFSDAFLEELVGLFPTFEPWVREAMLSNPPLSSAKWFRPRLKSFLDHPSSVQEKAEHLPLFKTLAKDDSLQFRFLEGIRPHFHRKKDPALQQLQMHYIVV